MALWGHTDTDEAKPKWFTTEQKEDIIEVEEIRDLIFDFVVKNSEKLSKCKYNEPPSQSGIEKVS